MTIFEGEHPTIPDQFLTLRGKVLSQSDEAKQQADAGRKKAEELMEQRDGRKTIAQASGTPAESRPVSPVHQEMNHWGDMFKAYGIDGIQTLKPR